MRRKSKNKAKGIKKMTKKNSKFLSLLLAAVMALSMAMTGFAATITVTNSSEGETYKAYKIFDVTTVNDETTGDTIGYSYTIDSGSPWYSVVSAATDEFTLTQAGDSSTYYVTVNGEAANEDVIAVFTNAVSYDENGDAYIGQTQLTVAGSATADSSGEATISNLDPGYYFVSTSLGSLVIIDTADTDVEIAEKNDVPTSEKKILEDDGEISSESVDNTKTVTYVLYARGVRGAVNLVIHDKMTVDSSVTYTFNYDKMTVYLYDSDDDTTGTELTKDTDYIVDTDPGDGCDFEVIFTTDDKDYDFSDCSSGAYVKVTISCTIDAGGYTFEDDEVKIDNGEYVTFGNEGESTWDYADVYEYGFEIYKYTGSGEVRTALANAEFELTNSNGEAAYFIQDATTGKYVLEAWGTEPDDGRTYTTVIKTNDEGMAYVEGLDEGTYTLTETKAPDGYNMLGESITVTITADTTSPDKFTVTQDGSAVTSHTVSVENKAGSLLPGTGGMGTTIFYIAGVLLIICAAAALIAKRRLDRQN